MKNLVLYVGLLLACALAFAQNTSQQDKMKACNADAAKKELKGDERKAFMKNCLSGKKETKDEKKGSNPQQEMMKKCNADAGTRKLKGDERKKFMSECLKAQ
jgi:predicted HAD superfamily hydrolase